MAAPLSEIWGPALGAAGSAWSRGLWDKGRGKGRGVTSGESHPNSIDILRARGEEEGAGGLRPPWRMYCRNASRVTAPFLQETPASSCSGDGDWGGQCHPREFCSRISLWEACGLQALDAQM